jgi:hydrogenase/urease accessory protein HupE
MPARRSVPSWLRWIIAILLFSIPRIASAHPEGFSGLQVTVEPQSVRASLTLHTRDFGQWFPAGKYKDYVNEVCRELERTIDEVVAVQIDGLPLERQSVKAQQIEVGLIEVEVRWKLPKIDKPAELLVWSKHLVLLPRDHQQLLFVEDRRSVPSTEKNGKVLLEDILTIERDAAATEIPVVSQPLNTPATPDPQSTKNDPAASTNTVPSETRAPRLGDSTTSHSSGISFFLLGIEHILTGYDHLLFLAALLLTCSNLREAAEIITCFTIAHSVTLALAALDIVSLPGTIVEPAIAASIVYVAIENLWVKHPAVWRRAVVTFLFGLIHGLGFASVLKDIGLGRLPGGVIWPLVRFNLGVETGQLGVAALLLPVLASLRRSQRGYDRIVIAASILIALCGAYWLITRVFS